MDSVAFTFALMGFIFGMSGLAFGVIAFTQLGELKKEAQKLID